LWQTTFKKKVENNPNREPKGDSKGGQFSKGDGGSGSDKDDNKKDEPKADPKQSLQKRGVKGDDLLNQLDSIDHFKNSGAKVNNDATVTVYHYTNSDTKDIIHKTGKMKGAEDGVFFTTKKDGDAKDFGNSLISANIPIELLNLDDDLGDELHLRIPTDKRGQSVDVSKFLNKESKCPDCGLIRHENNPNHAPSGDSKGGQFTKGDGAGSGDDDKKDEPKADPITKSGDVFNTSSYNNNDGKIAVKVDKVIPEYEKHIDTTREIWNGIPDEDKGNIVNFNIGSPPKGSLSASGTFDPGSKTIGVHLGNFTVEGKTPEEIKSDLSTVLTHEIAHSQFHEFGANRQSTWSDKVMEQPPITGYLKKFKNRVIKSKKQYDEYRKTSNEYYDELDDVEKEIKSGNLSDKSDDPFIGVSPLQRQKNRRDSLERAIELNDLLKDSALYNWKTQVITYGNETHSEFQVMNKGFEPLWKSDKVAFDKIKPIYDKTLGVKI
tara:strand:+ start:178 stop:1650 length:1473 start_codon:yes stop_codon:yes gene_type:complete